MAENNPNEAKVAKAIRSLKCGARSLWDKWENLSISDCGSRAMGGRRRRSLCGSPRLESHATVGAVRSERGCARLRNAAQHKLRCICPYPHQWSSDVSGPKEPGLGSSWVRWGFSHWWPEWRGALYALTVCRGKATQWPGWLKRPPDNSKSRSRNTSWSLEGVECLPNPGDFDGEAGLSVKEELKTWLFEILAVKFIWLTDL